MSLVAIFGFTILIFVIITVAIIMDIAAKIFVIVCSLASSFMIAFIFGTRNRAFRTLIKIASFVLIALAIAAIFRA